MSEESKFCWSQAELHDYDSADMKRWADASVLEYAYEEGRKKERQQMIQRLLKRNWPIEEIIEDLDLTAEEVASINSL